MKKEEIKLNNGMIAIVDKEDFRFLSNFKWLNIKKEQDWYAFTNVRTPEKGKSAIIYMHQFLIKADNCDCITFKNKNTLDNRKENLFPISKGLSVSRTRKRRKNGEHQLTSIYKGVSGRRRSKRNNGKRFWEARISYNSKTHYLGMFHSAKEAAKAYNEKAKELYGELAYQNKI